MPRIALFVIAAVCAAAYAPAAAAQDTAAQDAEERANSAGCPGAETTPAMNACMAARLAHADGRLRDYVLAAVRQHHDEPGVVVGIRNGQTAFEAYRDIECNAVHEDWKGGTIRTIMELGCRIRLTDARTHAVWRDWLTYPDGTPNGLPEPEPLP